MIAQCLTNASRGTDKSAPIIILDPLLGRRELIRLIYQDEYEVLAYRNLREALSAMPGEKEFSAIFVAWKSAGHEVLREFAASLEAVFTERHHFLAAQAKRGFELEVIQPQHVADASHFSDSVSQTRITFRVLQPGNYVNGIAGGATRLTTIVSVDPVYVYADMDEDSLLKFNALASQQRHETNSDGRIPVELQLGDEREFPHRGSIESLDNQLDPNTGSILLRAIFPNGDGRIVPGLFARIRVPLSARHPAVLISERAIGTDQALKYVLTLTPTNTVAYQPVELGPVIEGLRIVRSGLKEGDQIVVNGLQRVRPGMPVKAEQAVAASDEPRIAKR